MSEKETLFESKIKYTGIFNFSEFYKFCYDWLTEETGFVLSEIKYSEKIVGNSKNIEIKWTGFKNVTDYFRHNGEIDFRILGLTKVEVNQGGTKIETNKGVVEMKMRGILVRDYKNRFETSAFNKFLRGIYEKAVIASRIEKFQVDVMDDSNNFLVQAKAFLDLEGRQG